MQSGPRLRIVAINDVYLLDNLPRLASLVARAASHAPADRLLVTLAGDFLSPSMLSSLDGGAGMVDCLNHLGVTHLGLGNHEDDLEPPVLATRLRELEGRCLAANIALPLIALPTCDVVTVTAPSGASVRVGLTAVCTLDPALYSEAPFGGAPTRPPREALASETRRLLGELGCDLVVPLTHLSLAEDLALARETTPRYPVILGGHDHQVAIERVGATTVVKAGTDAFRAAVIDLAWPTEGGPPEVHIALEDVAAFEEEPAMRARVDRHMQRVADLEKATLYVIPPGTELSSVGTRAHPTTLATFFCSRLRDLFGADLALLNGGGIRGRRVYRESLTYGALKAEVPFENEVVCVEVPARVIADAIAASRARAPAEAGCFLHVDDGVVVGPDNRPVSVGGQPFDSQPTWKVATVREFFRGMDNLGPLVAWHEANPEALPPAGTGREVKQALVESFVRELWRALGGFAGVDGDGDGVVRREDLDAALLRLLRADASPITAELVFETLDADRDGEVTRDEA
jgi:5'-nucleotidase